MKKDRKEQEFLDELRKFPIVQVACERVGISRQSVYRWRQEDPEFGTQMSIALDEGEELVDDLCESQLFALVKDKNFQAIKYRLEKCHPKYRKPDPKEPERPTNLHMEEIIRALDLKPEDLVEENYHNTMVHVAEYMDKHGLL